ncbi:MAG: DUF2087 domain-containing protein [Actinobacteria bacterium]|nr:DUF2087 domain-containing protein [Actinomycetota bacterium]
MPGDEPLDWRAALALLANADTRAVFAQVAAAPVAPGAARDRALKRLLAAGLLEAAADGPVVAEGRLRATLGRAAAPPASGPERFLSRDGRIQDYPSRATDRRALLEYLVARALEPEEELSEPELGERLVRRTDDVATLRRYLVDAGLLERSPDGRRYRRVPGVPPPAGQEPVGSGGNAPEAS